MFSNVKWSWLRLFWILKRQKNCLILQEKEYCPFSTTHHPIFHFNNIFSPNPRIGMTYSTRRRKEILIFFGFIRFVSYPGYIHIINSNTIEFNVNNLKQQTSPGHVEGFNIEKSTTLNESEEISQKCSFILVHSRSFKAPSNPNRKLIMFKEPTYVCVCMSAFFNNDAIFSLIDIYYINYSLH